MKTELETFCREILANGGKGISRNTVVKRIRSIIAIEELKSVTFFLGYRIELGGDPPPHIQVQFNEWLKSLTPKGGA